MQIEVGKILRVFPPEVRVPRVLSSRGFSDFDGLSDNSHGFLGHGTSSQGFEFPRFENPKSYTGTYSGLGGWQEE